MPAHSIPVHVPTFIEESLLDEEFDIADNVLPFPRKPSINRRLWLCDDMPWDEELVEEMEAI